MMNPAEFANIAETEETFWWYRGMRDVMFRLFDPLFAARRFRRILEAGCGTGHFAHVLEERYHQPILGLDLAREGLQFARGFGLTRLVQGNLAALPFADSSFDFVLSMDVVVHFPKGADRTAFAEMARVLEPGGVLAVRVSALDVLRGNHSRFVMERQRFTRSRLVETVRQAGLDVVRCTYANSLLLPVAFLKFRVVEPLLGGEPESGVRPVSGWLNRLLEIPLRREAAWIGSGRNLPLGQSLILLAKKPR